MSDRDAKESAAGIEAVSRVLDGIGSDLDLKHVLHRVADAALAATSADRATVLVVEGDALTPAAVAARRPNAELFRRFRSMGAIPLRDDVDRGSLLFGGTTVVVEDCSDGILVPATWLAAFGTTSVAIAPVVVPDRFAGVLAIDYTQRHRFGPLELVKLEAIAQATRVAVDADIRRRDSHRASAVHRRLASNVAMLAAASDTAGVEAAVSSTIAALFPEAAVQLELPDGRSEGASRAGGRHHVLKVAAGSHHFGFLTVDGVSGRNDDLTVLEAVADHAALALDRLRRERELAERTAQAELMQRLSDVLRSSASPATLLPRINREIAIPAGFACTRLAMRHRRHVEVFRCRSLGPDEASLLARSADERHPILHTASRIEVLVTVPVGGRGAGVLAVATPDRAMNAADRALLCAIAIGLGQVAHASQLDRALNVSSRRLASAALRKRIVDDLDARLGPPLRSLAAGLRAELDRARGQAERERLGALHDVAMQAVAEAHTINGALAAISVREVGLDNALREVARTFEQATQVAVVLRCDLAPGAVDTGTEESILALVYDALMLIVVPGRNDLVSINVSRRDEIVVEIRDDGVGLEHRVSGDAPLGVHYAVAALRRRVNALGGTFDLAGARPRGIVLTASLPNAAPLSEELAEEGPRGLVVQLPARERPVS